VQGNKNGTGQGVAALRRSETLSVAAGAEGGFVPLFFRRKIWRKSPAEFSGSGKHSETNL